MNLKVKPVSIAVPLASSHIQLLSAELDVSRVATKKQQQKKKLRSKGMTHLSERDIK